MSDRPESNRFIPPRRSRLRQLLDMATGLLARARFPGSGRYWDLRYRLKGSSGEGSYGRSARFKANFVNDFVTRHAITSAIEFGCGDGAQLALLEFREYAGVDISPTAIKRCAKRFHADSTKTFFDLSAYAGEMAELSLSLDVIFHLVEDDIFHAYMDRLFQAAERFVIIYSTDHNQVGALGSAHVRHRRIRDYCSVHFPDWKLMRNGTQLPGSKSNGPRFIVFARV